MFDISLKDFPRLAGETSDEQRIMRAAKEAPRGILFIPAGIYEIAETVLIDNACSLDLHPNAVLKAVKPMDFVLRIDADACYPGMKEENFALTPNPDPDSEYWNLFLKGGIIDGSGLASCLVLDSYKHFTLRDISLRNGLKYGLYTEEKGTKWTYELVAQNVYCKCTKPGMGGNVAMFINGGDSHFIDCICVDYTIGFQLTTVGGSNRLTRCHVWGGPIPPKAPGELPEMLVGSINYKIDSADAILTDCYADTGMIGFDIDQTTRLVHCSYFNNYSYKMDNVTVIRHTGGQLLVDGCLLRQHSPHATLYEAGDGVAKSDVIWRDNLFEGGLKLPD